MTQLFPFQDFFYIATAAYFLFTAGYRFIFGERSKLKIPTVFYEQMSVAYFRMVVFVIAVFAALNFAILWTR